MSPGQLWRAPTHEDIIKFSSFFVLVAKLCVAFLQYYFSFEKNSVLKSKSPCILLKKNINFDKNETESKIENHTHFKRDEPCVSAHIRIAN